MASQLHPGARWAFRAQALGSIVWWMVIVIGAGILRAYWKTGVRGDVFRWDLFPAQWILIPAGITILLGIIYAEIYARLAYRFWSYDLLPDEFRSEQGIITKQYRSIPYARIQNVAIRQGIIARTAGFSEVYIMTAGSAGYEGYIPGVSPAEADRIKAMLLSKITKK